MPSAGVVAPISEERMDEATADEENGFQPAKQVFVSSTVKPAATPSCARNANVVAPERQPSIHVVAG